MEIAKDRMNQSTLHFIDLTGDEPKNDITEIEEQNRVLAKRLRKNARERARYAKMTWEQRKMLGLRKIDSQIKKNLKQKYFETRTRQASERRLICEFMNKIRQKNDYIVADSDKDFHMKILKTFRMVYPDKIFDIHYKLDIHCLVMLLKKWDADEKCLNIELCSQAYKNMQTFITNNLNYIQLMKQAVVIEEINQNSENLENVMEVTCSPKQLQTMLYQEFPNNLNFDGEKQLINVFREASYPEYLMNWPFISTQMDLPGFSMIHENINFNEFHLINTENEFQIDCRPALTGSFYQAPKSYYKSSTILVRIFLEQLKNAICKRDEIVFQRKAELITVLNEFEKDILTCHKAVGLNINNYINLHPYYYIRYLGYPSDGSVEHKLRLIQLCLPRICFKVKLTKSFEKVNGNPVFRFGDEYFKTLAISYKCNLCNVNLGSHSSSRNVSEHFLNFHGSEPVWTCMRCEESFNTNYLSKTRWGHICG